MVRIVRLVFILLAAAGAGRAARAAEAGPLPGVPIFLRDWEGLGDVKVDSKGVTLRSAAGDVTLKLGGRLHDDVNAASLDPKIGGPALSRDRAIRRAWFEPQLTVGEVLTISLQYDFASAAMPINDALVAYKGFKPFILVFGNVKEPFSMNQLESNNTTLFAERSLLDLFAPGRDVGLAAGTHGARWTVSGGVFGGNANTGLADNGVAGTARATYAPVLERTEVLHLGVAASYRELDRDRSTLSFSDTPDPGLFRAALVDTGVLRGARAVGRLGFEAAYQNGPFRLQSEYIRTAVSGVGAGERSFEAGYVEAGWTINGEGRPYRLAARNTTEYAVFDRVDLAEGQRVSRGGVGVFELGARFSAIDLRSGPVRGGAERDTAVGLNWYPDDNIRVMADYTHAHAAPSTASVTGQSVESDTVVGRLQVYW